MACSRWAGQVVQTGGELGSRLLHQGQQGAHPIVGYTLSRHGDDYGRHHLLLAVENRRG
jgi:hypothetical protein